MNRSDALQRAEFDHASREMMVADVVRPLVVLCYLIGLALLHDAAGLILITAALVGCALCPLLLLLTQRRRLALARIAALRGDITHQRPPLVGSLAFALILVMTILDGGTLLLGIRRQWLQLPVLIAPLLATLFVAWQWWFFVYWLSPETEAAPPRTTPETSKEVRSEHG